MSAQASGTVRLITSSTSSIARGDGAVAELAHRLGGFHCPNVAFERAEQVVALGDDAGAFTRRHQRRIGEPPLPGAFVAGGEPQRSVQRVRPARRLRDAVHRPDPAQLRA